MQKTPYKIIPDNAFISFAFTVLLLFAVIDWRNPYLLLKNQAEIIRGAKTAQLGDCAHIFIRVRQIKFRFIQTNICDVLH